MLFSRLLTPAPPSGATAGGGGGPVRADTQTFFLNPDPLRAQLAWALAGLAVGVTAGWPRPLRVTPAASAAVARVVSAAAMYSPALAPLRVLLTDWLVSMVTYTLRPTSRGRVWLTQTGAVAIDPAGLATGADMEAAVAGVVAGVRLLHTSPALGAALGGPLLPLLPAVPTAAVLSLLPHKGSVAGGGGGLPPATAPLLPLGGGGAPAARAGVEAHIRSFATTAWHAAGTCRMGTGGGAAAAADEVTHRRLRVNGVARLRVVDLSVVPEMVSGNTNATAMTVGARAAELVVEEWAARGGEVGA